MTQLHKISVLLALLMLVNGALAWYDGSDYDDYNDDYTSYWAKRSDDHQEEEEKRNSEHHEEEGKRDINDDLGPYDFVSGSWFNVPVEAEAGPGLDDDEFEQIVMDMPEIGPELEEMGCDTQDDFIQAIYYNAEALEDHELIWKVECEGYLSFIHTFGFPISSAVVMETKEAPNYEKKSSATIDPNTFVEGTWFEVSWEGLASDVGIALEQLMEMPKVGPLLAAKGCNAYENFIEAVFMNADNIANEELIFEVVCQGDISIIRTLGLPPYSVQELYVNTVL